METVEVLVRLPETEYLFIKTMIKNGYEPPSSYYYNIASGTVLPKGHGALKDYDAIKSEYIRKMSVFMSEEERMDLLCTIVDEAEVVIGADKEADNG